METKLKANRIFIFPDGARIDLMKIIYIGAIDKNCANGEIYISTVVSGVNKPINIVLGYSFGKLELDKKERIEATYTSFITNWERYKLRKRGGVLPGTG